jgi:SHS2 domain-containing protein
VTPIPPRHERIAHTAELALRLEADTPAELFAEACRALGTMLREETGSTPTGEDASRTVAVDAVDADALLVDLLNELIYLAETERWAPSAVRAAECTSTRVVLRMAGAHLRRAPSRIKSATHHGLALRRVGERWVAEVIFDV